MHFSNYKVTSKKRTCLSTIFLSLHVDVCLLVERLVKLKLKYKGRLHCIDI